MSAPGVEPLVPVRAPLPPDPDLQQITDLLDALTVTVVCHPDDEERVRTAAADAGPPIRVITSGGVARGQLVSWTATEVRSWAP